MSFDPYYEWLSIPPDEQPADHYRLIGVRRYETNRDVISNAAERQLLLLKSLQSGPHSHLTQRLMNEITKARICLLDKRKKSQYDLELKRQITERARQCDPPRAPLSPQLEDHRPLTIAEPPPPRMIVVPAPPLVSAQQAPSQAGQRIHRRAIPLPILGVIVGVATPLLLWLIIRGVWQPATDSTAPLVASRTSEQEPGSVQAGAAKPVSGAPVRRPPIPPVIAPEHKESSPVQINANADATHMDASAGHRVLDQPANGTSANVTAGSVLPQPPTPPASPEQPPNQSYTYKLRQKMSADRNAAKRSPSDVTAVPAAPTKSSIFGQLPADVDVTTALSSDKQASIVLGTLPASANENWQLALEDFAQPDHGSHFTLGDRQERDGCLHWPLIRTQQSNTSTLAGDAPSQEAPIGSVKIGPSRLELTIISSVDADLIERLSCCILIIEKDSERHCIQFRKRQIGPPMELGFERAKDEHLLDAMPTIERLAAGRVKLDVLGLELDENRASPSSRLSVGNNEWSAKLAADLTSLVLHAGKKELTMKLAPNLRSLNLRTEFDEELTVTLAPDNQCEMGVRLSADAQRLNVVVRPRYTWNERKQGLVVQDLEKDLARMRSQFAENQLDLAKAQAQLKAIPKELEQLSKTQPGSPQEFTFLQSRMENLRVMGAKSEATARRIVPLLPMMASDIERIEVLLILVREMSNRLQLRFRVVAAGELGDLVLFETSSDASPLQ